MGGRVFAVIVLSSLLSGCGNFARLASGVALGTTVVAGDFSASADSAGEDGPGHFFQDRGYGTDAYIGPLDVLLNKGFATAQWEGRGRDIFSYPYGWQAVWRSVSAPDHTVGKHHGWEEVLLTNFVPFAAGEWNEWGWYPNYVGHVVEGGIAYRRLREWLAFQGAPAPWLLAGLTTYAASVVNEAYEVTPFRPWVDEHGSANTMVDLYFFDPGGILLFSSDAVSRFFAVKLGAQVWPMQASIVAPDFRLVNNGHHLVFKIPLKFSKRHSLFFKSGVGVGIGLSHQLPDGFALSWAVGGESRQQFVDPYTRKESVDVGPGAGVWLDRRGSLLASLLLDRHTDRRVALNVYPGLLDVASGKLGAWLVLDDRYRPHFGLSGSMTLGAGVGLGF